jgi:hypothetical protein
MRYLRYFQHPAAHRFSEARVFSALYHLILGKDGTGAEGAFKLTCLSRAFTDTMVRQYPFDDLSDSTPFADVSIFFKGHSPD